VFCCTVDHVEVAIVPACLDSLLIGLYVLADEFFIDRRGPGRPRKITDAELSAWPSRRCCWTAPVIGSSWPGRAGGLDTCFRICRL
jgi:hypothetical protein